MDLRTGQTYESLEAARAAGVPDADIAFVVQPKPVAGKTIEPRVSFPKHRPFGRLKNLVQSE